MEWIHTALHVLLPLADLHGPGMCSANVSFLCPVWIPQLDTGRSVLLIHLLPSSCLDEVIYVQKLCYSIIWATINQLEG